MIVYTALMQLVIVGGFLGSGKTTSLLRMSKIASSAGRKVAIVTNDQGSDLVDTGFLRAHGLEVGEVSRGCFCCNFHDFADRILSLSERSRPDIVFAEPVGSCTDLAATVFRPAQSMSGSGGSFAGLSLRPFSVVLDARLAHMAFVRQDFSRFPEDVAYLFRTQLAEADLIALNKIDLFPEDEVDAIRDAVGREYPGARILPVSATRGDGMAEWLDRVLDPANEPELPALPVDYARYGSAEALLGWLNGSCRLEGPEETDWRAVLGALLESIRDRAAEAGGEIAHLKAQIVPRQAAAGPQAEPADPEQPVLKASIVAGGGQVEFAASAHRPGTESPGGMRLILNARIRMEPGPLRAIVDEALHETFGRASIRVHELAVESFAPAFPKPVYRMERGESEDA